MQRRGALPCASFGFRIWVLVTLSGLSATVGAPRVVAQTFGPPTPLSASSAAQSGDDAFVELTTDAPGTLIAVWTSTQDFGFGVDQDILASRSIDGGETWSVPVALNAAATDGGNDWLPAVAADGAGTVVAVWQSNDTLGGTLGTDDDILVARSVDGGQTWSAAAALNASAAMDAVEDWSPRLATDGAGTWVAAWRSTETLGGTIESDFDILTARSVDGGATWSTPIAFDIAATDGADDREPYVATDGTGAWLVVWQSRDELGGTIGGDFDILVARSFDGGLTWSTPVALNGTADSDAGFDDLSPQVAGDGTGTWVAVWEIEHVVGDLGVNREVVYARSTDGGVTWSSPTFFDGDAASDGVVDSAARVATDGAGTWLAAWNSGLKPFPFVDLDVTVVESTDGGLTWTHPTALNDHLAANTATDLLPAVAPDGMGGWVVAWLSDDDLGGTIGSDFDVLVATGGPEITVGVEATKLLVVDKIASFGRAKVVFVSKDRVNGIQKAPGTFPDGIAADVHLAYVDGSVGGDFIVPAGASDGTSGWVVNKATSAKFVNRAAPAGSTQAKVIAIKPGRVLKLSAQGLGDGPVLDLVAAGPPSPSGVATAFCVDNEAARICHCSIFTECIHQPIAGGTGAKLVCRSGQPDAACTAAP